MRKDWEIRKLGDVCEISYGDRVVKSRDSGSLYPVYGGGGATFFMDTYNREDSVVISRFGMSPKCVRFVKGKFFLNDSGLSLIANKNILCQSYLDIAMFALNDAIYSLGKGAAQKNLDVEAFNKLSIKYPISFINQQQIVEEFDSLTSIIEKHKKQLEELDNLAQSIFYDMFGDPLENEKGWKLFFIDDVCVKKNFIERAKHKHHEESIIYYIDISSVNNKNYTISKSSEMLYKDAPSRAQQCVKKNDILVSLVRPNLKNIALVELTNNNLVASSGFCVLRIINNIINEQFLKFCLIDNSFTNYLVDNVKGANYPAVNESDIRKYKVPVPPLPLQQEFASKIEAIEKQKELIKKSIKETEDLFNSRMDYYFN